MLKSIGKFIIEIVVITAVLMGISVCSEGMYLIGIPSIDEVDKVMISYPMVTEEVKIINNKADIETAVKLTGFLKYSIFKTADESEKPMITITYCLKNNETVSVSANNQTVWWKGKAYQIRDDETFINLTEGIFFLDDLIEK